MPLTGGAVPAHLAGRPALTVQTLPIHVVVGDVEVVVCGAPAGTRNVGGGVP